MQIHVDLYRFFYEVALAGSISGAARILNVTQPAVSQAIKQLEQALGTPLFVRLPRGTIPTEAGRNLFSYVDQAFHLLRSAEQEMGDIRSLDSGEIFIAAGDTLCRYYLLSYLEAFHDEFPGIRLRITNRTSTETVELLRKGVVELGIVNLPCDEGGIEIRRVGTITDCFVAGSRYAERLGLTNREKTEVPSGTGADSATAPLSWKELAEYPLLLLEQGTNTRNFLDSVFREADIVLQPEIELGSVDLLIQFARIGLGISAVIREFVTTEISRRMLYEIPLSPRIPSRAIGVAYRSHTPLSLAAGELLSRLSWSNRSTPQPD